MKGVERHPYLVVIDGKVWGDKDGKDPCKAVLETEVTYTHMHLRVQTVRTGKSTGKIVSVVLSESH